MEKCFDLKIMRFFIEIREEKIENSEKKMKRAKKQKKKKKTILHTTQFLVVLYLNFRFFADP